jgi:hypothetical protein
LLFSRVTDAPGCPLAPTRPIGAGAKTALTSGPSRQFAHDDRYPLDLVARLFGRLQDGLHEIALDPVGRDPGRGREVQDSVAQPMEADPAEPTAIISCTDELTFFWDCSR